jgi:hypothetical protein
VDTNYLCCGYKLPVLWIQITCEKITTTNQNNLYYSGCESPARRNICGFGQDATYQPYHPHAIAGIVVSFFLRFYLTKYRPTLISIIANEKGVMINGEDKIDCPC